MPARGGRWPPLWLRVVAWLLVVGVVGAVAVVIVALTAGSSELRPGPPALLAPSVVQVGVNVNYLFNTFDLSREEIDAQLAQVRATGATIARSDAFWEASEPSPPNGGIARFNWSFDDSVAGSLARNGLQWLPIVDYTAPWDQSVPNRDHSPPASDPDYAAYAGALAARYGPGGIFWRTHPQLPDDPVETYEIWNEPDNAAFWVPQPDPAAYAQLYTLARNAIKVSQPTARVVVGGLISAPTFVAQMLNAEPALRSRIDGVAIHPYAKDPAGVLAAVIAARRGLDSAGLTGTPLYVTEFGWTTQPASSAGYAPAQTRRRYIEQTLAALGHLNCRLASIILYTWVTPEMNPADDQDWYGINSPAGGGPDVSAYAAGVRAASTVGPTHPCA